MDIHKLYYYIILILFIADNYLSKLMRINITAMRIMTSQKMYIKNLKQTVYKDCIEKNEFCINLE